MLNRPTKWRADRGARALRDLVGIKASIDALSDDDLLDLADIFVDAPGSVLSQFAAEAMQRRGISL